MRWRIITAAGAAIVYGMTYSAISATRGDTVWTMELFLGVGAFFITFALLSSWLDRRRAQKRTTRPDNDTYTSYETK